MGDANDHQKLLKPPPKLEKITNPKKNELICGQCKKNWLYQIALPLEP
jgi:hypothetical protein